ncbi:hypothetical protein GM658_05970 [Pseudoduganella eburnea]|uniref:DUF3617 family protein n=1 Tax=Massilia eburnea TaxID=1776165 RepID=A0A6L6QDM8_9BURK|nr:hypothetical protein [Massilia eburnea]MTW10144.1 hypothetical protein [Massilia eburnea]
MLISFSYKVVAVALMATFTSVSQAQEVGSLWQLHVQDLKRVTKVEATIRFANDADAESCMAGKWSKIVVEATAVKDEKFFPLAEPLAYKVNQGEVTLGRTQVCDGYLFLSGKSDASDIQGAFNAVSIMGIQRLGYFSLKRVR